MTTYSQKIFKTLLLLLALTFSVSACSNKKSSPQKTQKSQQETPVAETQPSKPEKKKKILAPNFTLKEINGKSLTLSNLRGKVVVLNIWATWCPPCRHEIPDFIKLQKELGSKGLQIIGVSVDRKGVSVVRNFAKEHHMNYPVMVDNGIVQQEYGPIKYVPTTFVINRQGYIEGYAPGMLTENILKPILLKLLDKKTAS